MATFGKENKLNATMSEKGSTINGKVNNINYIPDYKKYELERQSNEAARISNELKRQTNEIKRMDAEESREERFENKINAIDTEIENVQAKSQQATEMLDDIQNRLDSGEFKGEKGEKGDPGEPGRDGVDGKDGAQGPQGIPGEVTEEQLQRIKKEIEDSIEAPLPKGDKLGEDILIDDKDDSKVTLQVQGNYKTAKRLSINLLEQKAEATTKTTNGITYTLNSDNSITIKGTATGTAQFLYNDAVPIQAGKTYTKSYYNYNNTGQVELTGVNMQCRIGAAGGTDFYGSSYKMVRNKVATEDTTLYIRFSIIAGTTVDTTIYPMFIEGAYEASTIPAYEEYGKEYNDTVVLENSANVTIKTTEAETPYTLPIQAPMIVKDYFRKDGVWKEHHYWTRIARYSGEQVGDEYISSTGSLSQGATVYYHNEYDLICTPEQSDVLEAIHEINSDKVRVYSTDDLSPIFHATYLIDVAKLSSKIEIKPSKEYVEEYVKEYVDSLDASEVVY